MNEVAKLLFTAMARAAAIGLGAWLLKHGYVDGSTTLNVEGSIICLAGVAWQVAAVFNHRARLAQARAIVPPGYVMNPEPLPAPQATMAPIPNP